MGFENTTFYIIPVAIGNMRKYTDTLLSRGDWESDETICRPDYLLSYIHSLAHDPDRFRVLRYKKTAELPIHMFRDWVKYTVAPRIEEIYLCAFGTGVAFLEYRVAYGDMPLEEIKRFAYNFKKADNADHKGLLAEGEVSMMTATKQILYTDELGARPFFAYRNNIQYNCICYHLIRLSKEQKKKEDIDRLCFYLKRSYNDAYLYDKENDGSDYDMVYKPYSYMVWAGCQEGLVMITHETDHADTNSFLDKYYYDNLICDYHFMYLILLNQRFSSLLHIEALALAPDDSESLERINADATELATRYAFHVVSDEMVYQNIYTNMYHIFHIDKLLSDVEECRARIKAVQKSIAERNEKRTSGLLAGLSWLTFFSALVDATGYVDRFTGHFALATALGSVGVAIVFTFFSVRNWVGGKKKK